VVISSTLRAMKKKRDETGGLKRSGPGRPTRLDQELKDNICGLLTLGVSVASVCDALNVSESRYYTWQKTNVIFREETKRARVVGKIKLVREIAADRDWRAKSWLLSVIWPNEFGKTADRPLEGVPDDPEKNKINVGIFFPKDFDPAVAGKFPRKKPDNEEPEQAAAVRYNHWTRRVEPIPPIGNGEEISNGTDQA
jgi:hypothetical protein